MCNGLDPLFQVSCWPPTGVSGWERLIPPGSFLCAVLPAPGWIQRRLPSLQPQPVWLEELLLCSSRSHISLHHLINLWSMPINTTFWWCFFHPLPPCSLAQEGPTALFPTLILWLPSPLDQSFVSMSYNLVSGLMSQHDELYGINNNVFSLSFIFIYRGQVTWVSW